MEVAVGLPKVPVPVSQTHVHYHIRAPASGSRTRSRSAPTEAALAPCWPLRDNSGPRVRPTKATRKVLQSLSVEELSGIAREYGLKKLCCPEDQRVATRLLPESHVRPLAQLQPSTCRLLESLSWDQLIGLLRELAHRRMGTNVGAAGHHRSPCSSAGAEYLAWVFDVLLGSQLRDDAPCQLAAADESLMAWRSSRICADYDLTHLWEEVARRLGGSCGSLLYLFSRPVPRLDEELRCIRRLVSSCHAVSIGHAMDWGELECLIRSCDVLYVGGMHDRALNRLKQIGGGLRLSMAILNVCCSGKLAKHLVSRGVRHATYWPAFVSDSEAASFGVGLVNSLFEDCIADAFERAKFGVSCLERAPKLISRAQLHPNTNVVDADDVVLEQRGISGKPGYAEKPAKVLPHTAVNGWVRVCVGEDIVSWRAGHWRSKGRAVTARSMQEGLANMNVHVFGHDDCRGNCGVSATMESRGLVVDTLADIEETLADTEEEATEVDEEETEEDEPCDETLLDDEDTEQSEQGKFEA